MTGKSGALYKAVFKKIKEELPDSVNPKMVMCDFEAALLNGLKEIFPEADVTGCWFHFSQCIFKHTVHFGLKACFVENEEFTMWVQLVMAMPLLPQDRIVEAWNQLKIYPVSNMPRGY